MRSGPDRHDPDPAGGEQPQSRGLPTDWVANVLDPDVVTFGFARRVPSYKRLTLMLRDPERLKALLTDPKRPIQIVIAGKSHPAVEGGKALIQQMVQFADDPEVRERIVFLPDYDISMAKPALPGLRRLDEQSAAAVRGLWHLGDEGGPERGGEPVRSGTAGGTSGSTRRSAGRSLRPRASTTRTGATTSRPRPSTTSSRTRSCRGSTRPTATGCPSAGSR